MSDASHTDNKIRLQRTKLTLSDLGMPALVKTARADQKTKDGMLFMGTVYGRASGFIERINDKQKEGEAPTFEGLKGVFVGVPADDALDEKESGLLWIPDAFHNMIAEQLRLTETIVDGKPRLGSIEFAFEVYSIEAKNPAGYSWVLRPAVPPTGKHPLADLMDRAKKIQIDRRDQIEGPKKAKR
jgi:hypothetical protein